MIDSAGAGAMSFSLGVSSAGTGLFFLIYTERRVQPL